MISIKGWAKRYEPLAQKFLEWALDPVMIAAYVMIALMVYYE